jgi:hypothetical protein
MNYFRLLKKLKFLKKLQFLSLVLGFTASQNRLTAQNLAPEQIVQKNLDCYNKRDIEGFMDCFSDEISIYTFPNCEPSTLGLGAVRQLYQELFALSPRLHSTILKRIVFDNKVIDHESIIGRRGSNEVVELVLIYEVKNHKIYKITVIRK